MNDIDSSVNDFDKIATSGSEVQATPSMSKTPSHAFVSKCIHPPSAIANYEGLPTNDTRSQVAIEWRNVRINATPFVPDAQNKLRPVVPDDLSTFNLIFLMLNGLRATIITFIETKYGIYQDANNVFYQDSYDFKNWRHDARLFRPTYKSTTFSLNATAFNDTGIVTGNQFNPSVLFSGTILDFVDTKYSRAVNFVCDLYKKGHVTTIRPILRDSKNNKIMPNSAIDSDEDDIVTVDPVVRPNYTNGRFLEKQWNKLPLHFRQDVAQRLKLTVLDALTLDPDVNVQVLNLGEVASAMNPVPTSSQILQNSARSSSTPAKEGAFSVQRINTISPEWLSASNTGQTTTFMAGLYKCYYAFVDSTDSSEHFIPFLENGVLGQTITDIETLRDTLWTKDMTCSWVRFDGLSLNNQTQVQTQLIIAKSYVGCEVQPSQLSPWQGMMKLGPQPDLKAMQALMDANFQLKDVLPSRFNFWGVLGSLAANGIKEFGSSLLKDLVKSDSNKPVNKKEVEGSSAGRDNTLDRKVDRLADQMRNTRMSRQRSNSRARSSSRGRRPMQRSNSVSQSSNKKNKRRNNKAKKRSNSVKILRPSRPAPPPPQRHVPVGKLIDY